MGGVAPGFVLRRWRAQLERAAGALRALDHYPLHSVITRSAMESCIAQFPDELNTDALASAYYRGAVWPEEDTWSPYMFLRGDDALGALQWAIERGLPLSAEREEALREEAKHNIGRGAEHVDNMLAHRNAVRRMSAAAAASQSRR